MEEAAELGNYLPLSFKSPKEQEYIAFLWDVFDTNYTYGKYQFAFLAYHMLTMSFVYSRIWQIKQYCRQDFAKAIIGFSGRDIEGLVHRDDDDEKKRWDVSPFLFSKVQERSILRILALIGCDKPRIGCYIELVDARNETAHANGNISFSTQTAIDTKVAEILRAVDEIQTHSGSVIERCYHAFLAQSHDPETREYPDAADQIREALIHSNYMSQRDVDICLAFDIETLAASEGIDGIRALHIALASLYGPEV